MREQLVYTSDCIQWSNVSLCVYLTVLFIVMAAIFVVLSGPFKTFQTEYCFGSNWIRFLIIFFKAETIANGWQYLAMAVWPVDLNNIKSGNGVRDIMLNAIFNNISVILWRSVLLMEETGVPGENHQPVATHWQIVSHNVVSSTPHHERDLNSQL